MAEEEGTIRVLDSTPEALAAHLAGAGLSAWRVKDVLRWIFEKRTPSFEDMSSLPKDLRAVLAQRFVVNLPEILREQRSVDGTVKSLLGLSDGSRVEMALIPAPGKNTLCVSSQVGCARKCAFCATAGLGLLRNLTVGEILGQVYLAGRQLDLNEAGKLTNIVFMGMGEPMDNLDNVLEAIRLLQHEAAFRFSPRRITLSTCGVIPGIAKVADSGVKVKLAVSLNAAIQEKREHLMPIARQYPLDALKEALIDFRRKTAYRVTLEYIMIRNLTMGNEDVRALRRFSNDLSCKINLIPWNPVAGLPWESPSAAEVERFRHALEQLNAAVTLRNSRGADIDAACGQLAAKSKKENKS